MAREIYYAVQRIATATVRNEVFAGEVHTGIFGKGNFTLFTETDDGWYDCNFLAPYWVRKYGYKRKCDAMRNWVYKNPDMDEPYWKGDVRIITIWVHKDNKVTFH